MVDERSKTAGSGSASTSNPDRVSYGNILPTRSLSCLVLATEYTSVLLSARYY